MVCVLSFGYAGDSKKLSFGLSSWGLEAGYKYGKDISLYLQMLPSDSFTIIHIKGAKTIQEKDLWKTYWTGSVGLWNYRDILGNDTSFGFNLGAGFEYDLRLFKNYSELVQNAELPPIYQYLEAGLAYHEYSSTLLLDAGIRISF